VSINQETVQYETYFNHTGAAINSTGFATLADFFDARAEAIQVGFSKNFDVFWSAITGDAGGFLTSARAFIEAEVGANPNNAVLNQLTQLYTDLNIETAKLLVDFNPAADTDFVLQSTRITTLALEGKQLLLVAHGQGNYFAQDAYDNAILTSTYADASDTAERPFGVENIGIVQIAPPVPTNTVDTQIRASGDVVLDRLEAAQTVSVPGISVQIPASHAQVDPSGHSLLNTYLNTNIATFQAVANRLNSEMTALQVPTTIAATNGAFTATLTWNGSGDADLHVFEPDNTEVFFGNTMGTVGFLDVDNASKNGPEHYYAASCASGSANAANTLADGVYSIRAGNFTNAAGLTATVQVSTPYVANLITEQRTLGVDGETPVELMRVQVSRVEPGPGDPAVDYADRAIVIEALPAI